MDLEKLDLEKVDKEMAADEAAQSSAAETDAPENALESGGAAANTYTCFQKIFPFLVVFFFFFFWCPCFRAFCKSGFETICFWFWEKHYLPSSYGLLIITIAHVLGLYLNLLVCTYLCL